MSEMPEKMPDNVTDRPLVTFALFAYNQEKYIREAVEGAFAQTYEPLEIILSDDCSCDRTFEIMQEMAAAYEGPHQVRARQSEVNVGTLSHVLQVAHAANGTYLVVAAGDDISLPERTSVLFSHFTSNQVAAISSDDIVIDETGRERDWHEERIEERNRWHEKNNRWILGATAAYRCDLLTALPLPSKAILHEDTTLQEIFAINNKRSLRLKDQLIKRRSHAENISFKVLEDTSIWQHEDAALAQWKRIAEVMSYCKEAALQSTNKKNHVLSQQYMRSAKYFFLLASWPNLSISKRVELLHLAIGQRNLRTCLPRLFGRRVFSMLKIIKDTERDL